MPRNLKLSQPLDAELRSALAAHEEDVEVADLLDLALLLRGGARRRDRSQKPATDDENAEPDEDREKDSQLRAAR